MRRHRSLVLDLLVVALFVALGCIWWWPLPLHLRTGQLEFPPIDTAFNQWIIGWGTHALTTDPAHFFDANMFYPHDNVLAWGDHLFALSLVAVPLVPMLGVVGASNVLLVGSTAMSGFTTYLLVRHLVKMRIPAIVAGAVFAMAWHRRIEWAHIQIQATHWIPLVFLAAELVTDRATSSWHDKGTWWRAALLAVAAWFVLATNVYLAVFTVLSFAVYGAVVLATRRFTRRSFVFVAAAWTIALVAVVPLYVPSLRYQREVGVTRSLEEQTAIEVNDLSPWPPPGRAITALKEAVAGPQPFSLHYYFPDVVTAALVAAGVALVVARRRLPSATARIAPFAAAAAFATVSALGPTVRWHGRVLFDNPVFLASYHLVPGYNALRLPARWSLLAAFFAAVVGAFTLAFLLRRVRRPVRSAIGAALLVAVGLMLVPAPWGVAETYAIGDFPAYEWLASAPKKGAIVELPVSADVASPLTQQLEAKRMLLSTHHWRDRVSGGISPVIAPDYASIVLRLNELPAGGAATAEAMAWLRAKDVRYVVFSASDYAAYGFQPDPVRAGLDAVEGLELRRDFGDQVVYEVTPPER